MTREIKGKKEICSGKYGRPNSVLCAVHQIKLFHIFVRNLEEIYLLGKKLLFSKTKCQFSVMAAQKLI